jgi:hypothetical protein
MKTLTELMRTSGLPIDPHLMLDLAIPVEAGLQAQGDLLIVPLAELADRVRVRPGAAWVEVPPDGVELLRGGTGGNAHTLVADPGTCVWTADVEDATGLALGVFEAMAVAYLMHREHGGAGIAPGVYTVRRQRELTPQPTASTPAVAGVDGRINRHRAVPRALEAPRVSRPQYRYVAD